MKFWSTANWDVKEVEDKGQLWGDVRRDSDGNEIIIGETHFDSEYRAEKELLYELERMEDQLKHHQEMYYKNLEERQKNKVHYPHLTS